MIHVADTHALVWALKDESKLGKKARKIFESTENLEDKIIISIISLIECIRIAEKKELGLEFADFYQRLLKHPGYEIYPLSGEIILKVVSLTSFKDLHDRIIVATALANNAPLITKDRKIKASEIVETIW